MPLADAALANAPDVKSAVDALASAMRELRDPGQVAGHDKAVYRMILATERLQEATKAMEANAKRALVEEMAETGVLSFDADHHTVSRAKAPRSVIITGTVPPEFMSNPEPKPDKPLIAKALKDGPLPWATLSNGGPEILRMTGKKQ